MPNFVVGDKLHLSGGAFVVEVLEIGVCEVDACTYPEAFRFADPITGEASWMHSIYQGGHSHVCKPRIEVNA
jgi:hypothetical protein